MLVQSLANTLKFTPPLQTVAPRGDVLPGCGSVCLVTLFIGAWMTVDVSLHPPQLFLF
jgi:hypothetical protein